MAASIFNGNKIKALKRALRLFDQATIYSEPIDPTVVGWAGEVGDVLLSTTTGKLYIKQAGGDTSWDVTSTANLTFSQAFDATTDWGSLSAGYYTITVLASTHNKGINPIVQVFEQIVSDYEVVTVDQLKINASGDVSFSVIQNSRFAGKVLIK